jgi:hypothetical protein
MRRWGGVAGVLAVVVGVALIAGGRHSAPASASAPSTTAAVDAPVGVLSPTGAAPGGPTTTIAVTASTTSTPAAPEVVAAQITLAYLNGPSAGRRARCRPFDTDQLDADLGAPSWDGGGNTAANTVPAPGIRVGVPVLVDNTSAGRGYEITISADPGATTASVFVVPVGGGAWRAQTISVS